MRKLLWISFAAFVMGSTAGCVIDDTYSVCSDTSDCSDLDDQCVQLSIPAAGTFGNFCTHSCSGDFDCERNFGFDGACYNVEGAGPLCYQTCVDDLDCYSSSVCIELALTTGGFDYICVPDN